MEAVPALPEHLKRLVRAALAEVLPDTPNRLAKTGLFVPNLNDFVVAWAAAYLIHPGERALTHLEDAYEQWQIAQRKKWSE